MARTPRKPRTERKPWHPAPYDAEHVHALQALAKGEAGPIEQKRALDWIVNRAAMTYDEPFDPESSRSTDYVLGRRSVGLQIVKLINLKAGVVAGAERGPHGGRDADE